MADGVDVPLDSEGVRLAESGVLEAIPELEAVGVVGSPDRCEGGDLVSPKIRRSERKKAPRFLSSRSRLAKSSPKSPLMRMAEMRRSGLRGSALRRTGLIGMEGAGANSSKGRKRGVGRGGQRHSLVGVAVEEDVGGEVSGFRDGISAAVSVVGSEEVGDGCAGEGVLAVTNAVKVLEVLPMRVDGSEEMVLDAGGGLEVEGEEAVGKEFLQASAEAEKETVMVLNEIGLVMSETDIALDLVEAQPLQNMEFLKSGSGKKDDVQGSNAWGGREGSLGSGHNVLVGDHFHEEDFPPLNKEASKKGKGKIADQGTLKQGKAGKPEVRLGGGADAGGGRPAGDFLGSSFVRQQIPSGSGKSAMGQKTSMAEMLRAGEKDPVMFEPEKIRKIGIVGESGGVPSIYFSGSDNSFLAEKLGHAVVGKFSHSIPSTQQIQKALQGLKFLGEFSWSFINAKHVLIQFKLLADYAKLLSGPNGLPVWFIDRHPMRVFKWTSDFDPFFESPIAAIWCNLVGLPIHLFEKSALFAIGGLLGTPIQVDHATITKKRLSFARLCIEIDISKPPPEEIVIDIQGREIRQRVIWSRIPKYCHECRHVGHSTDACYANGNKNKPAKKNYNSFPSNVSLAREKKREEEVKQSPMEVEAGVQHKEMEMSSGKSSLGVEDLAVLVVPEGKGSLSSEMVGDPVLVPSGEEDENGFQMVWSKKGNYGRNRGRGVGRSLSFDRGRGGGSSSRGGGVGSSSGYVERVYGGFLSPRERKAGAMEEESLGGFFPNPKFFKSLPNGDFDDEQYEDENEWDPEEEQEGGGSKEQKSLVEKREASRINDSVCVDDGSQKKGRFESSGNLQLC